MDEDININNQQEDKKYFSSPINVKSIRLHNEAGLGRTGNTDDLKYFSMRAQYSRYWAAGRVGGSANKPVLPSPEQPLSNEEHGK